MAVIDKDSIIIDYTLTNTTDNKVVSTGATYSLQIGGSNMLPGFEAGIIGMDIDETKTITLTPENAWGVYDTNLRKHVPFFKHLIGSGDTSDYPVGSWLPNVTPPSKVIGVTGDTATIDCNNVLAGKNLSLEVTLKQIRVLPS
jgi:peptidylprolyl isomerase